MHAVSGSLCSLLTAAYARKLCNEGIRRCWAASNFKSLPHSDQVLYCAKSRVTRQRVTRRVQQPSKSTAALRPRTAAFDHLAFQVQSSLRPRQQWRKCTAAPPTTRPLSGTRPHGTRTVRSRSDCLNKPPVRPAHARHASPCLRICLAYHLSFLEASGPGEGVQKLSLIQLALR